jgi:hypothetical protein
MAASESKMLSSLVQLVEEEAVEEGFTPALWDNGGSLPATALSASGQVEQHLYPLFLVSLLVLVSLLLLASVMFLLSMLLLLNVLVVSYCCWCPR